MKRIMICSLTLVLLASIGCTPEQRSPDSIRHDTAKATTEAAKDAKAVVQGVVEGLKAKGPVNINKANADELQSLPGISDVQARRIVSGRPYESSDELVKRRIITKAEYDRIAAQVVTR